MTMQRKLLQQLKRSYAALPIPLEDGVLLRVRKVVHELKTSARSDFGAVKVRELGELLGAVSAQRAHIASLAMDAMQHEGDASAFLKQAAYTLQTVRAIAATSDRVRSCPRADLRREALFLATRKFERVVSRIEARHILLKTQRGALDLALSELMGVRETLSRQITVLQMEAHLER
jgi:hypothetical protein